MAKLLYMDIVDFIKNNSGCELITKEEEYVDTSVKIVLKCACGNIFTTTFGNFKTRNKRRCSVCSNRTKRDTDYFKMEISKLTKNEYQVLGIFKNTSTKILMKHNKCGHIYEVTPNNFLNGKRCPACFGGVKKTNEQFIIDIYNIVGDEYSILSEYENAHIKVLIRHNTCLHEWYTTPNDFFNGSRCPACASSKGELLIKKYLDSNNILFKSQFNFDNCINPKTNRKLLFDFAIFNNNKLSALIEYDGEFHYQEIDRFGGKKALEQTQFRDSIKTEYCKQNNIPLLRIPYWDFSNLEDILKNFLNQTA